MTCYSTKQYHEIQSEIILQPGTILDPLHLNEQMILIVNLLEFYCCKKISHVSWAVCKWNEKTKTKQNISSVPCFLHYVYQNYHSENIVNLLDISSILE